MSDKKRTFTIQASEIGFSGGDYKSDLPSKAAKKAAKRVFALAAKDASYKKFDSKKTLWFVLREKTRDSEKKVSFYKGMIQDLKNPKFIMVKSPGNADADEKGMIKYAVTKEIKIAVCTGQEVEDIKSKA